MHERSRDGGVDSAGQPADHSRLPYSLSYARDLLLDERTGRPGRLGFALGEEKVRDHLAAARSVRDFRMKLHAENRTVLVLKRTDGIGPALGGHTIARGWILDVIPVIHPRRNVLI